MSLKLNTSRLRLYAVLFLLKILLVIGFSSCGLREKIILFNKDDESRKMHTYDQGFLTDTVKYFYPVSAGSVETGFTSCDTSMLSVFSGCLLYASEPLLYSANYPDCVFYRLMVFKSEGPVKIFTLSLRHKVFYASIKEITRPAYLKPQPDGRFVPKFSYLDFQPDTSVRDTSARIEEYESISLITGNELRMTVNKHKIIDGVVLWDNLNYEMREANFHKLPAYTDNYGTQHYILETKFGDKYWLVDRTEPEGSFKKCCKLLMSIETLISLEDKVSLHD